MALEENKPWLWSEADWDVVMEARSFIAVYAASNDDDEEPEPPKAKSKPRGSKAKGKGKPTRKSTRGGKKKATETEQDDDGDGDHEDVSVATQEVAEPELFWLAELRDDVTANMLDSDVGVHVRWLSKVRGTKYEYAFDDVIDVQTILCHVYMHESNDGSLELTTKSLQRVNRCVQRTRGEITAEDDEMMDDDDEKPPPSRRKKRSAIADSSRDDEDDGEGKRKRRRVGSGGRSGGGGARKLSKREEAMHIPPKYTKVDDGKYADTEIRGTHAFKPLKDDTMSTSKEVIRAVVTKNHKMLKKLTEDKNVYMGIHTFSMTHGPNVKKTALHYAIETDDLVAAGHLLKARKIEAKELANKPEMSLPSHSTGKHTSAFSDYNRRAINASRGGREGNNALMEDQDGSVANDEDSFLWECNKTSVKMLTLFFPTGEWTNYGVAYNVAKVCRAGNYKLASKLIETLNRNGGWGFNELHSKVLSDKDEDLPAFRSVSAIKQAYQTKIRPLHLAAINPNNKYLEALWDSAGDERSSAKDDLSFEPIHFAAACESTAPLAFLLEKKCNMFARTKRRQTPIMRAIATGRDDNAILILEKAEEQDSEVLTKVISERGPGSFQPVHYAARYGCAKVLEYLLKKGADVNSICENKMTALCLAAREGHTNCINVLLQHNAKVDMGDKLKKTPLIYAVKNGHTHLAALLINEGANVNAYDTSDNSVAHYAASYGWTSCLELLAGAGADFWAKNSWGFVPLTCALLKQRIVCSEFILERDPNQRFLDFRDRQGCTMLFLQCSHSKNASQIKYLLDKGLNPNIPDSDNIHPLQVLIQRAEPALASSTDEGGEESFHAEAIRLLLDNKASPHYDIEVKVKVPGLKEAPVDVFQPLQIAIERQLKDVFLMLLSDYHADPNKRSSNGMDAWMTAAWNGVDGEYFLEALLKNHSKLHKGKKMPFTSVDVDGDNIFHCVAANNREKMIDPKLVRELIQKCENPSVLINQKNPAGETPLQKLINHERSATSKDLSLPEHADLLQKVTQSDMRYSEIVELFAEYAKTEASWVVYLDETRAKEKVVASEKAPKVVDRTGSSSNPPSDKGSDDGSDDDDSDEAEDSDEDEDEGEGEHSASSLSEVATKAKEPAKLVKFSTILHAATNRKLRSDAKEATSRWFGKNLVTILLKRIKFDKDTVNIPDYSAFKTALHYAVERGDAESVAELLKNHADPNHSAVKCDACSKEKIPCLCPGRELIETALVVSTRRCDREVTRLLLASNRANVKCFEKDTLSRPLHLALAANEPRITKLLLDHGADLSQVNSQSLTPLHLAVKARHSVIATKLHEGEVQYTDLTSKQDATDASLSAISEALGSEQAKAVVMAADDCKRTPVHLAAANRELDLLRALVGASSNKKMCVNKCDVSNRTPLHYAVNASSMDPDASFEVERFLLQSGADPNAVDEFGFSVLHFALFKVDLDWHAKYEKKKPATEAAREREEGTYEKKKTEAFLTELDTIPSKETDPVETVSNLTSIPGIKTTLRDIRGRTPLHLTAATGAFVCASALLSVQANAREKQAALSLLDKDEFTPLGRAVEYLRQTTIMTLLQNGADANGTISVLENEDSDDDVDEKQETDATKTRPKTIRSYFYHAVKHSLTGICHMLLSAKFSKRQAVEDAILCGQFQLASNLIVSVEVSSGIGLLTKPNEAGHTLLHSLAQVDKPFDDLAKGIAWTLVDAGLKANVRDKEGFSPIHYAANLGNIHLMDFLLHNKCSLNQQSESTGETPLIFALKRSKLDSKKMLDVVQYFVENPAFDFHAKDKCGCNVLSALLDRFASCQTKKKFAWIELLLKKGVDSNGSFASFVRKDFFKNELFGSSTTTKVSPLIRVVYADTSASRVSLLGLLLRYGAKISSADSNGNSVLMHLAANNLMQELQLVLGKVKTVRDRTDNASRKQHTIHIQPSDIKSAINQVNKKGQTVMHFAVKSREFGSHENAELLELLIACGGNLHAREHAKRSPIDYTLHQASRFLYRFLHAKSPKDAPKAEHEVFDDEMEDWEVAPDYTTDAAAYIEQCKSNGKIKQTKLYPKPNANCDVGSLKRVFGELDDDAKIINGKEYDALLTKVDVKNGRFGLNVFYRCQIVEDQIQGLYVVFTNWGRIGEVGKFQNTPFHAPNEAIDEFKKIFRSKTGNHWHDRHAFLKHANKYNLVQRVNYHTELKDEVTMAFVQAAEANPDAFPASNHDLAPSVMEMLFAITDVRNLQLAATDNSNFKGSLPLANADELRAAVDRLIEIRDVIESRNKLDEEMQKVRGDMSDTGVSQLADLSQQHLELTEEVSEKSSRYYEVMPCDEDSFGSSIKAFNNVGDVNAEITRLRLLIDITHAYKMLLGAKRFQTSVHPLDYCYDAMQVNIAPVAAAADEAKLVTRWFFNGLRKYDQSRYRISNIFQVSRNGERSRFVETLGGNPTLKTKHSQLLWHGTRRTNLMGILSQGLRIAPPEAPHHGYMYGKGLYFANVAAKSLAYCDAEYVVNSTSKDPDGKTVKKTRKVHYLLACEVALGESEPADANRDYTKPLDGVQSVRAFGQHYPDPTGSLVSPLSGVALPLGTVGQIGVAFPFPKAWTKSEFNPAPRSWDLRNLKTSTASLAYWDKLVEENEEGQSITVDGEAFTKYFFGYNYASRTIKVDVLKKDTSGGDGSGLHCTATLKMTVKESDGSDTISWEVKSFLNVYKSSPFGEGFSLVEPSKSEYDELIVYNEGQARIRYLVEVESL